MNELLKTFQMYKCKPVSTPLLKDIYSEDCSEPANVPYREVIGSLKFLVQATRPDLTFSVSFLSRALERPTKAKWNLAMRVLRYLSGTGRFGITYFKDGENSYSCFSDADYASCPVTRRSVPGMLFARNQGPIMCSSSLQKLTTLSSCESELVSATSAAQSLVVFHRLASELGYSDIPTLQMDNQASLALLESDGL